MPQPPLTACVHTAVLESVLGRVMLLCTVWRSRGITQCAITAWRDAVGGCRVQLLCVQLCDAPVGLPTLLVPPQGPLLFAIWFSMDLLAACSAFIPLTVAACSCCLLLCGGSQHRCAVKCWAPACCAVYYTVSHAMMDYCRPRALKGCTPGTASVSCCNCSNVSRRAKCDVSLCPSCLSFSCNKGTWGCVLLGPAFRPRWFWGCALLNRVGSCQLR